MVVSLIVTCHCSDVCGLFGLEMHSFGLWNVC